ncbi:MAG: CBS domain-containing protein [bacterium]
MNIVTASQIMSRDVITVSLSTTVKEIAAILNEKKISGLPVVNEKKELVGIVSEGDLIWKVARPHIPPHIQLLGGIIFLENFGEISLELKKMMALTASEIMTSKVVTITEETAVEDAAALMLNKKINRLPVTRGKEVVGIITRSDIIRTLSQADGA